MLRTAHGYLRARFFQTPADLQSDTFSIGQNVEWTIDRNKPMKFLSLGYRFLSNFVFLALVYYSLNFMEKYNQRTTLAILVLVYAAMRAASTLRSFYFFQRIERLELEARRFSAQAGDGPGTSALRNQIVNDVGVLRHTGEMNSYVDLLFLSIIVLLCVSKIVMT
jgi:hypothetical protein